MKRALVSVGWLMLALAGAATSCSARFEAESNPRSTSGNSGEIAMRLDVGGTHVGLVNYVLTNGTNTYTGVITVSDASQLLAVLGGIEAGFGYVLTLNAIGSNGVPCSGTSAPFTVVRNATVIVGITLICRPTIDAGSVKIQGSIGECAIFSSVSAGVPIGNQIQLSVTTTPAVPTPPATISWQLSQGAGSLSSATGPNPVYTCSPSDEDVFLDLTMTQGGLASCTSMFHLIIDCPPPLESADGG